ncbi:MAG: SWF/SNF helicase family protein, partial [bacterium]|nr:SWF/SNF helicase family protein [bacterium]
RTFAWRNTRALLRTYRMQGLLDANVPERRPQNVWIALRDDERALYERVEEYISDFYERYEAERRGLGFVMTVFRRRLTSSFYALRRSLERRRAFLDAGETAGFDLSDDDLEEDELELDVGEKLDGDAAEQLRSEHRQAELAYLDQFLDELAALGHDSKLERLGGDLRDLLGDGDERDGGSEHRTVLVFTQYTDTMDYLRDELRRLYGARVACYSGRGGEVWDGTAWVLRSKELLKDAFRRGDEVRILLCTESASEGLNLQTCGELVNFDMPWNPMQVEQRIGRIDRIGQRFREVRIRNYFYEDTVEATIYQRLGERIGWFEDVVGELEPILHRVGEAIRKVAMVTGKRRTRRLEEELVALRRGLGKRTADAPDLAALLADLPAVETAEPSPVTLPQLEAVLVGSEVLGRCFTPDPAIAGAYRLREGDGESLVSFSPAVFDRYPNTVELLTYGNPRLAALLASAGDPEDSEEPTGIGLYRTLSPLPVSVFVHPASGVAEPIPGLDRLRALAAAGGGRWTGSEEGQAAALVSQVRQRMLRTTARVEENRRRAERLALVEAARQVLVRSALIELAAAQSPGLFEEVLPYGFGAEAVRALGRRGQPFRALLRLTGDAGIEARSSDPFFVAVQGRSSGRLRRKAEALVREGNEIVEKIAALDRVTAAAQAEVRAPSVAGILERQWFPLLPEVVATAEPSQVPPLRILEPAEVRPFKNSVPLYEELDTPASRFAEESTGEEVPQADELRNPGDYRWVQLAGRTRPARGLFVSRVMGEAMNRRIPDGVWGLFRLHPQGSHHGKVVLARHREIHDPELGGAWTLRIYERDEGSSADGSWQHRRVVLKPASTDPGYEPIVLEEVEEGVLKIVAEFVEIVG